MPKKHTIPEKYIILLLGVVQFIDILDFMMVMPLGPDFAKALGFEHSLLGYTAVTYTLAAAFTGLVSSKFLDRFERKRLLLFALGGLSLSTLAGGFAWDFDSLLVTRVFAGICGGTSTAVTMAIITDLFDEKRRGEVMGKVMSAFSFAAIIGVPFSLNLSNYFNWQAPFFAVSTLGFIVIVIVHKILPEVRVHLDSNTANKKVTLAALVAKKENILAYIFSGLGMLGAFMIIPYISAHLQQNLDFPREDMDILYLFGGIFSFFAMRIAGKMIDKHSSSYVCTLATIFLGITMIFCFAYYNPIVPVALLYFPFMIGMSMRNVANYTLVSKVPDTHERAGFMALLSFFQNIANSIGAFLPTIILIELPSGRIDNMATLGISAFIISIFVPMLMKITETILAKRHSINK
jgi:predicted MFS family arabinose efflux permease